MVQIVGEVWGKLRMERGGGVLGKCERGGLRGGGGIINNPFPLPRWWGSCSWPPPRVCFLHRHKVQPFLSEPNQTEPRRASAPPKHAPPRFHHDHHPTLALPFTSAVRGDGAVTSHRARKWTERRIRGDSWDRAAMEEQSREAGV